TEALDGDGEPLQYVEVVQLAEPPPASPAANQVGIAYDYGPDGATFEPPATLVITYDPASLPEGVAEEDLVIARFDSEKQKWIQLESLVDPATHTVMAEVADLAVFAVYVAAASTFNLWVVAGPVLGLAVPAGLLYYLNAKGARRRKLRGEEEG
ncbi:MAG: hypothetical protein V3S51_04430, partial [Dehalococcoidia bacterium]